MVTVKFSPSDVTPFFPNSVFQKGEWEAMAAWIIVFLHKQKDDQWVEFTWEEFAGYLQDGCPNIHPVYLGLVQGPFARQTMSAFGQMIQAGYIDHETRDDQVWMKPSGTLMEFYSTYVA